MLLDIFSACSNMLGYKFVLCSLTFEVVEKIRLLYST